VTPDELIPLAWLAGRAVEIDDDELRGAVRRAMLLLAAGGDPHRGLDLDGRAVTALADELDSAGRREALQRGLRELGVDVDAELAWRSFACGLLAEELAGEEPQ
jgi:hypothetical protein